MGEEMKFADCSVLAIAAMIVAIPAAHAQDGIQAEVLPEAIAEGDHAGAAYDAGTGIDSGTSTSRVGKSTTE